MQRVSWLVLSLGLVRMVPVEEELHDRECCYTPFRILSLIFLEEAESFARMK